MAKNSSPPSSFLVYTGGGAGRLLPGKAPGGGDLVLMPGVKYVAPQIGPLVDKLIAQGVLSPSQETPEKE